MMEVLQGTLDRLKGGVSRRVEMEMAMIKLCSPEMDSGMDSLLRRLEAVEAGLRSGAAVTAVAAPVKEAAPAPIAAKYGCSIKCTFLNPHSSANTA